MEQAAALTMSDKTAPPTREATPAPKEPKEESATSTPTATTSATTSSSEAADATPTLSQRLYTGNFEEEVGQVMKGLGSFWGGFKAKVSGVYPPPYIVKLTSVRIDTDVDKVGSRQDGRAGPVGSQAAAGYKGRGRA